MKSFNQQKREHYSIRKYKIGVCSTIVALSLWGTAVSAEQLPNVESTPNETVVADPVYKTSNNSEATSEVEKETVIVQSEEKSTTETTSEQLEAIKTETVAEPVSASETPEVNTAPQSLENTTTSEEKEQNLIANGDFTATTAQTGNWSSEAASDWEVWVPSTTNKTAGTVSLDEGRLHISSTDTYRVALHQTIDVDPNKKYTFSYDVETKELKGSGVRARLRSLTAEGKDFTPQEYTYTTLKNGTGTTTITQDITVSPETRKLKIELFFENSVGQAWLDNVALVEYVEPVEEVYVPELPAIEQETVTFSTNKVYLPARPDLTYTIHNSEVARLEKGLIFAVAAGTTTVDVYEKDNKVSSFELVITDHQATVFDTLRDNWEEISLANSRYKADDPNMQKFLNGLETGIASSLEKWMEPNPSTTSVFNDIDFSRSSHLTTVYRRLEQMAQVIENPNSIYYHDREIIDLVRSGMDWLYTNVYNENKEIVDNWWDYEIGTPRAVVNILIYMHKYFSQEEINKYTKPISKFVPDPTMTRMTVPVHVPAVGGNQTDLSKVSILEGALREDAERVAAGSAGLTTVMSFVDKGEGFYKDGSFIDHDNIAYTGGYGNVLIEGFSQLLPVIHGTEFALKEEQTAIVYEWIEKSFMPILVRGELMDMTRGRSVSRAAAESHVQAMEVLRSLVRIAESADPVQKSKLKSFVKAHLIADTYYDNYRALKSYKDIELVNSLLADDTIIPEIAKDYIAAFNNMDKFVYGNATDGFTLALSMYSSRTQNYEDMNNENRKGWYTADGMVYLYNGDLGHYSGNYWPTVDPYRLPGTTVTKDERQDGSGEVLLASGFVGATQLGERLATVAMDFNNWNDTLTARKAWFILGDKIVFLGTDVQHSSEAGAHTTIENRKLLENEQYSYYINGKLVDLTKEVITDNTKSFYITNGKANQSIGYVFLNDLSTHATVESRTGKWSDINYNQPKAEVSNQFVTLWCDHSQASSNYAYVMVPNKSLEEVARVAATVKILKQDRDIQVVYDAEQAVWGIVKYTNDAYALNDVITLTNAGVYTIQEDKSGYRISFYNPETRTIEQEMTTNPELATAVREVEPTDAYPSVIWKVEKVVKQDGQGEMTGNGTATSELGDDKQVLESKTPREDNAVTIKNNATVAKQSISPKKMTSKQSELPDTGENNSSLTSVIGIVLGLSGLAELVNSRRREDS